jgi:serine/threonine-protein kinase
MPLPRTATGLPPEAGARPALVLPRPAGPGSDIVPLLRRRLFIVALLAAATAAFFFTFRSQLPGQMEYFRASRVGTGLLVFEGLMFASSLGVALLLRSRRPLTLAGLRTIELVLVAAFAIYIAWAQLFAWTGVRFVTAALPAIDPFVLRQAVDSMAGRWVALIVGVATLVPETLRRTVAIVAALAITAIAVTLFMAFDDPLYRPHLGAMLSLMTFWMVVASTIAIFGSSKLAELRQQVDEARRLGQYRLLRRIGAGAMGEVFLAEHLLLKQPCAIKLLRPELARTTTAMQRFEREVRAVSRLTSWNTVRIYDYGYADDGTFYYAMEYLPGFTLEALVRRFGLVSPARAIHFLRQMCAALREAHGMGLVHRDIKPANVMACVRGGEFDVAKLLDFGTVRQVGLEGDTVTLDGAVLGTPAYMSPEQIQGGAGLDGRSDIYSVGAVGYFLLTGAPPFERDSTVKMLVAHVNEAPAPLRVRRPDAPADLEALLLRCLAKAPADRFADVGALHEALDRCADAGGWNPTHAQAWWEQHGQAVTDGPGPTAG